MKLLSRTDLFLRRQRRRSRGTLLAWSAAVALLACAWTGAIELGWIKADAVWALGPVAGAGYLLVRWVRRVWRLDDPAVAREVDAQWQLGARLESALELAGSDSAVAVAQRLDTATLLATKKPTGTAAWLGGLAAVTVGLTVVGVELVALDRQSRRPPPPPLNQRPVIPATSGLQISKAPPSPPPEPLQAAITWKSPEPLIKAKAQDEIPLLARTESNHGYHTMVLDVAVNGTVTNSYPLTATALAAVTPPGGNDVKLALFLDEIGAKPSDIVSYYLQATANLPPGFPAVLSNLQFIQVRPNDEPPEGDKRYAADAQELLHRLGELKQAQMQLLEKNFDLARTAPAGPVIEVNPAHSTVAAAQKGLAQTAEEARAFAGQIHAADGVSTNLAQAAPAMVEAAASIAARESGAAAPLQARSLASIVEAEKVFRAALDAQVAAAKPETTDPTPTGELTPRNQTPAGRLEELARRQGENNRQLQQYSSTANGLPALAAEQALIARAVEKLAAERALVPTVQKTLEAAIKATAEAARQLGLNDPQAAREPAAEAQALLKHAVDAQENEGRKAASELLEQVRQELNDLQRSADPGAQPAQPEQIHQQVGTEARRQQRQGSAEAAQKLSALENRLNQPQPTPAPTPPPDQARADAKKSPSSADTSSGGASANAGRAGAGGKQTEIFMAELRPPPTATGSTASGQATITLRADKSIARVAVTFSHLSSTEAAAYLAVNETDGQGTVVLTLGVGQVAAKSWWFEPVGNLTHDTLLATLESGQLLIAVPTANYPKGELTGQFILQKKAGDDAGGGAAPPPSAEPQPTRFEAELWPLPNATTSRATGTAGIVLSPDKLLATLNLGFEHLTSAETAAFLKVGGTGEKGATVFTVGVGHFSGKSWRFEAVGGYTREALVKALESGELYLEIDSTIYPKGELDGLFVRQAGASGGAGGGGAGGAGAGGASAKASAPSNGGNQPSRGTPRPAQKAIAEMPTLGTQPSAAQGAVIDASIAAAESQIALAPDNSLAQTIRQLKAATTKLGGSSDKTSSLALLQIAAQKAQLLAADPRLAGVARDLAQAAAGPNDAKGGLDAAALKALSNQADELVKALEQVRPGTKRDEWVRRYAPEEVDPDYRKAVSDYFEQLSREGAPR